MIINKTPHAVQIKWEHEDNTCWQVYESDSDPIRLDETRISCGEVEGIPVSYAVYGAANLPEEKDGIYYIVSAMVMNAYPERLDLLAPGPAIRNASGQIIACEGLSGTTAMLAKFQLGNK